jgi:5-methylcytosine-specific restriction enzyme A
MKSFLLVWNPKNWKWLNLRDAVDKVRAGKSYEDRWTCQSKKVRIGDRFFLMRLGSPPKGIIGSGQIQSVPYYERHYDDKKAAKGLTSPRVNIRFDRLSEDPIINENELKNSFKGFNWFSQQSGISMPDEISNKLQDLLDKSKAIPSNKKSISKVISEDEESRFPEGGKKYGIHRSLERDSSIAKKAKETRLNLVNELRCDVCNFSFSDTYGILGNGFIEAHHTIPVSELKGVRKTTIKEIALVCSNCHRMLHKGERSLSVEKLRELIRKT